jgi:hypothetical protein
VIDEAFTPDYNGELPMLKGPYQLLVEKIVVNDRHHIVPTFRVPFLAPAVRNVDGLVEFLPPNPKPGPTIKGDVIPLTRRKRTLPNCRDEVLAALKTLIAEHGDRPFPVREVYARMREVGTSYAELTVYKAMQQMKRPDPRLPDIKLERIGREGFRLASQTDATGTRSSSVCNQAR